MANNERLSDDEKIAIVADYLQSGLSQVKYHKINEPPCTLRTFERWCTKHKKQAVEDNPEYKGASRHIVHRDEEGTYLGSEWIKYSKEIDDAKERLKAFAEGLKETLPKVKAIPPPKMVLDELLACYVVTDYHFGLMAEKSETMDEDWNLEKAEQQLIQWFQVMIEQAPDAHTGLFLDIGDLLHTDGLDAVTPTSGHPLDASNRYSSIVKVVSRVMRQIISMMLQKHKHVHIIHAEGNHNLAGSVWLREMMSCYYENEPRVTVDNTELPYYAFQWGNVSLFAHHGHKKRMSDISGVFAGMFREIYGQTKYSYVHVGHMHHIDVKENNMMVVEQHRTLAPKDAHAARGGYNSKRSASAIIYHKKYGEVNRLTVSPEMLS